MALHEFLLGVPCLDGLKAWTGNEGQQRRGRGVPDLNGLHLHQIEARGVAFVQPAYGANMLRTRLETIQMAMRVSRP